ncbi:MAG: peptidylprolyl isomerase [Cyanobacteriota bacterium]|nr:peptidylprolyl isomerase [Cyanobacteriota bacterium]
MQLAAPQLDAINRWTWAPPATEISWQLLRQSGRAEQLIQAWIEHQICALVPLEPELEAQLLEAHQSRPGETADDAAYAATAAERLQRFKRAQFSLHVDEHFTRTKRQRDRIIYSMLRCSDRSRVDELALAIREGDLDFAAAAIRYSEGPESAQGGRIGPISPHVGHPELNSRLEQANEGDLIGPFAIGDMHVLLRLDTRITTRLDEALHGQLIEELYAEWLQRQVSALLAGESIEPMEYLPES